MEGYRICASTNSSCLEMVCPRSTPPSVCVTDAPWQIIDKKKKQEAEIKTPKIQAGFVAAKGSVPVKSGKKRKLEESENLSASTKKTKAAQMIISSNESSPSGLVWDGDNYSCAYDALFTILYEIWSTDTRTWKRRFHFRLPQVRPY